MNSLNLVSRSYDIIIGHYYSNVIVSSLLRFYWFIIVKNCLSSSSVFESTAGYLAINELTCYYLHPISSTNTLWTALIPFYFFSYSSSYKTVLGLNPTITFNCLKVNSYFSLSSFSLTSTNVSKSESSSYLGKVVYLFFYIPYLYFILE